VILGLREGRGLRQLDSLPLSPRPHQVPEEAKKEKILKRKNKDPNAPKKALSAFMLYSNKVRDSVKKANPDMSFGELGKAIANKWNAMGPDQKKVERPVVPLPPPPGLAHAGARGGGQEYEEESEALKAKYLVVKAKCACPPPPSRAPRADGGGRCAAAGTTQSTPPP